ncbi:hypothetical protein [Neisseria viridiae]|nr:hypothetical protein [Neisseria viridiae]
MPSERCSDGILHDTGLKTGQRHPAIPYNTPHHFRHSQPYIPHQA